MPRIIFETECGETTCDNCVLMSQDRHGNDQFCNMFNVDLQHDKRTGTISRCQQCLAKYGIDDTTWGQGWKPISEFVHTNPQPFYVFQHHGHHLGLTVMSFGFSEMINGKVHFTNRYTGAELYPTYFFPIPEFRNT